jgi:hypothetical protein
MKKSIEEIDNKVVEMFKSLGFELEDRKANEKKEAPAKKGT